jgi:hypothetical protein
VEQNIVTNHKLDEFLIVHFPQQRPITKDMDQEKWDGLPSWA